MNAESITINQPTKVLDKGFVRLVDSMGGDDRIVQAARVSYGAGTKTIREDRDLIRYLMRNGHMSPFEQVLITLHVKMPIFVARQWVRHRTARLNEISARYSVMTPEFYIPAPEDVRFQSTKNRQGRSDVRVSEELTQEVIANIEASSQAMHAGYKWMIEAGISRELARIILPVNLYTEWYWNCDLRNIFNFLKQRLDEHAQLEIRMYAQAVEQIVRQIAPVAYEAFEDYQRGFEGIPM